MRNHRRFNLFGALGATRSHDRLVITNDDDLYANLPVGAAGLQGTLARAGSLTVEMDMVGRYEAARPRVSRGDLRGACDGATHFVYGAVVGAFSFFAVGDASGGASFGLGSVGAGSKSTSIRETLTRDGDRAQCAKATPGDAMPPAECGGILRLEVVPISPDPVALPVALAPPPAPVPTVAAPVPPADPAPVGPLQGGARVHVSPGTFQMGSPPGTGESDEQPLHTVAVTGFDLDATEVTVAEYDLCVRAGVCLEAEKSWGCNEGRAGREQHPINCVTRDESAGYCRWAGKRLPTEEEWEYAARGSDGRLYPWGSTPPATQLCWNRSGGTCPVGSFRASNSPFGAHDMAGNVREWTASGWSDRYDLARDPTVGIDRGGSWDSSDAAFARAAERFRIVPSQQSFGIGFRCAR